MGACQGCGLWIQARVCTQCLVSLTPLVFGALVPGHGACRMGLATSGWAEQPGGTVTHLAPRTAGWLTAAVRKVLACLSVGKRLSPGSSQVSHLVPVGLGSSCRPSTSAGAWAAGRVLRELHVHHPLGPAARTRPDAVTESVQPGALHLGDRPKPSLAWTAGAGLGWLQLSEPSPLLLDCRGVTGLDLSSVLNAWEARLSFF